jgi:hypothetical protein
MRLGLLLGPVIFILWLYCVINVITSRDDEVRHLPKVAWLVVVLLFPLVGSIAWLAAGRPVAVQAPRSRWERPAPEFPEYDRPGRAAATDPEADAEFLRRVRERAEEQRRIAREQKKRQEPEDDQA